MDCRSRTRPLAAITIASLAWTLPGCDAQVSPFYRGESLLTVSGSVEIPNKRTPGPLVPALVFASGESRSILVVDTEVQGKFPSDFRLDVYDAPPNAALISTSEQFETDEKIALGFISAVPKHHRHEIRFADTQDGDILCPDTGCAKPIAPFTRSWCTSVGKIECYTETLSCTQDPIWGDENAVPDGCTVTAHTGDISLKEPWREFAGFSQNYMVLYLPAAAPADSYMASVLGATSGLERGYYLLALNTQDPVEYRRQQACLGEANDAGVARYVEMHGAQYTADDLQYECGVSPRGGSCPPSAGDDCIAEPPTEPPAICALPEAEQAAIRKQVGLTIRQVELERECWKIAPDMTLITDPEHVSISVTLGSQLPPQRGGPVEDTEAAAQP
jgi:hypothetical protein